MRQARAPLRTLLLSLAGCLLALATSACTYFAGDHRVLVTSAPAGAAILVDGEDTGFTTPHMLDLGGFFGDDHVITVRKRGYTEESRTVYHYTTFYTSKWIDGASDVVLWPTALWWTTGDMLFPFAARWVYVPHDLYVQLHREGEAPVKAGEAVDVK